MKQQVTFRLTKLALVMGVALAGLNASAVYNIYRNNGLTLDINGQVDVQATRTDAGITALQRAETRDANFNQSFVEAGATVSGTDTDKKTRLSQNHGVSYIDFRGAQVLPQDWRVTGNVGLGYSDANNLYLSNASLSLDKKNIGAITLGRQYLHTNYVNRTGTDTPLDIFSTSALRLDYYGLKNLHASAYYSFIGLNDVRNTSNTEQKSGYGASLSYRVPLANNQSFRIGAGYTESRFNPALITATTSNSFWLANANTMNRYPEKAEGAAASLEYQVGKFLVAADFGQRKEKMVGHTNAPIDTKTTDYFGAKLAYDINPVWQVSAGYGVKKADVKLKDGKTLSNDVNGLFAGGWAGLYNYVDVKEQYLFNKADTKEMYIQTDYRLRPNVRLYGRYDDETTTYKLNGADFSKAKDKNARIGFVFSF